MKNDATPIFYVPTSKRLFDFHMKTFLQEKCPGPKRLGRLFELYKVALESTVEFTESGFGFVRTCIEAYKTASDSVITADFRLLRQGCLVFMCAEKPTPAAKAVADLFANIAKEDVKHSAVFSDILSENSVEKAMDKLFKSISPDQ